MAQGNYREYLRGPQVRIKKYFYVLRPLLAVLWIEHGLGVVPMEFETLLSRLPLAENVILETKKPIVEKRSGKELDVGPRIPAIGDFIDQELGRLEQNPLILPSSPIPIEPLDDLFQETLREVWTP
jgi:predicted nucleotidyltransferase